MIPISKHKVHKYERVNLSKNKGSPYWVYRCTLPNCNHYIQEQLIWNKVTTCWRCGNEFVVTNSKLKGIKHPYCEDCKDKHWNAKPKQVSSDVIALLTRMGIPSDK